ncbi:hypothetical protein PsorP6_018019 [Peronosclerospora sorghi]|uniref:Uncharacterized protein n=1 Tax=Peronosclerospora sorghi TaxID=230839 RepID=A0ACC0WE29_9STRA|nr:hypothetical protein PsorP6_018019 [Peronosclerospora sorghi]
MSRTPPLLVVVTWVCSLASVLSGSSPSLAPGRLAKAKVCAVDMHASREALALVHVTPERAPSRTSRSLYPMLLCFVNTISVHHATRARAVADTWGQRCDKLVFFSNASDTIVVRHGTARERRYDVIRIDAPADHNHLWQKHKATLRYVHAHYRHAFDWFYKVDDDAYVVVENLKRYLRRPEILQRYKRAPMHVGHRFNLTQALVSYYIVDAALEKIWRSKWDRWVFNSGGPGYGMNRRYLDTIVHSLRDWTCLSDQYSTMLPDDASIAFCMMWHDVYPWDTRDHRGRERWHANKPHGVYFANPHRPNYWYTQYHQHIGGVRSKEDSIAPDSVAFHYIRPALMYHLERTLYLCRTGDEIPDLAAFNEKYGLALGEAVIAV